jgi:hypothetical protein
MSANAFRESCFNSSPSSIVCFIVVGRCLFSCGLQGSVTFSVWIVCTYKNGKRRAHGREFFIYAVYKVQLSIHLIHDDYRFRFGIESSYRMKNQFINNLNLSLIQGNQLLHFSPKTVSQATIF